jgi:hypothetical protein
MGNKVQPFFLAPFGLNSATIPLPWLLLFCLGGSSGDMVGLLKRIFFFGHGKRMRFSSGSLN